MSTETIVVAVGLGVNLLTVLGVAIKLSARFATVEASLKIIEDHILNHIYSELSELRKLITDHITRQDPKP